MNLQLSNKRVLVVGASRGIGYAISEAFLKENAKIVMLARNAAVLEEAARKLGKVYDRENILTYSMDCSDQKAWEPVIKNIEKNYGGIDIVIANVGDGSGPQDALPEAGRFASAWRTNFSTAEETARSTLDLLKESKGSLLIISSIAGLEAIGAPTDYSVAKAALIALTKQMSRRLAPEVRVNCIAPGNVFVEGGNWEKKLKTDKAGIEKLISDTVPMKRFGLPEEIADAAVFLSSERATFITGSCLVVDGGQTVGIG